MKTAVNGVGVGVGVGVLSFIDTCLFQSTISRKIHLYIYIYIYIYVYTYFLI